MRVLGVIPARGGSKRIPRKNLRLLRGQPLIAYTIDAAEKSRLLTHYVVSTDDQEIARVASDLGAYVVKRPEELADDLTSSDAVALHALEWMDCREFSYFDMVLVLHPTSPIRNPDHIDKAIETLRNSDATSLASVEYAKRSYRHNASIYATKVPFTTLYNDQTIPFLMDKAHSLDIDDETDWKLAEMLIADMVHTTMGHSAGNPTQARQRTA